MYITTATIDATSTEDLFTLVQTRLNDIMYTLDRHDLDEDYISVSECMDIVEELRARAEKLAH